MDLGIDLIQDTRTQRFRALVLPHLDAAYNLARWLLRNDADAQDVAQEAYLRAFRFFEGFQGDDARAWLLAIVRNRCYSWIDERRRLVRSHDPEVDVDGMAQSATRAEPESDPLALVSSQQERERVDRALASLPLDFREVLVLREIEDLSYKEIATVLDMPIGTVMSRLSRARSMLAGRLSEDGRGG